MYINQNPPETEFLLSCITNEMKVLEYGSGGSTVEIGKKAKSLISMEHTFEWYIQVKEIISANTKLCYVDNLIEYVYKPIEFARDQKFDIIFIDGEERVKCAEICNQLGHENTLVFFHDYNRDRIEKYEHWNLQVRHEYFASEKYLIPIKGVLTMWMFKIKF